MNYDKTLDNHRRNVNKEGGFMTSKVADLIRSIYKIGGTKKMVKRTEAQTFDEFEGTVESVDIEESTLKDGGQQYHITINPENVVVEGKTGKMHEWVRIPPKATDVTVPEGSVIDRYLIQLELLQDEVKEMEAHAEAFKAMVGKKYLFKRVKHGRAFEDHKAKEYWTPVKLL